MNEWLKNEMNGEGINYWRMKSEWMIKNEMNAEGINEWRVNKRLKSETLPIRTTLFLSDPGRGANPFQELHSGGDPRSGDASAADGESPGHTHPLRSRGGQYSILCHLFTSVILWFHQSV